MDNIVSVEWLHNKLEIGASNNIRILDVTLGGRVNYDKCHIPGAVFFDITHKAEHTEYLRRNLPKPEYFEEAARLAGINNDTHVVVCDGSGTNGFYFGGRAWWMFYLHGHEKVSVLNGGIEKWLEMGYPTSNEMPQYEEGNFQATLRKNLIISYEQMVDNLTSHYYQVVDTRPADQFKGNDEDPKSGYIPGAKSVPHPELLDKNTGLLKDIEMIKQMFEDHNINFDAPLIGSCNTATSASTLALLAKVMGKPDVPLYLGSFQEWKRRVDPHHIARPKPLGS